MAGSPTWRIIPKAVGRKPNGILRIPRSPSSAHSASLTERAASGEAAPASARGGRGSARAGSPRRRPARRVAAAALRDQLLPYRGLPVWIGTGIGLAGLTDHYLGLLARALGELDEAVAELERARDWAAAEGMAAFGVLTTHELARTQARRGRPGDAAEAARPPAEAASRATRIGLVLPR